MGNNLAKTYKSWQQFCKHVQEKTVTDKQETISQKTSRIEKLKKDYNAFVKYYFPHYADCDCGSFHIEAANAILDDPNVFAVLEWAREHAKSVHADIMFPMWLMLNEELRGMVLVGKSFDDACTLLSDIQAELQYNQRIINDLGEQFNFGSWEEGEFITRGDVMFAALGRGQSPRGIRHREKRPNYCVVDDIDDDEIINNTDRVERVVDWILGALYGALDIRGARFVMVGNRIDQKSILAHIVGDTEPDKPKRKNLYHSKVSATIDGTFEGRPSWHQKFTSEQLQRKFETMGYYMAMREYFHKSVRKGKLFRAEWIHWDAVPALKDLDQLVAYFDPSYKPKTTNDFKAIRIWGRKARQLFLVDCFVRQATIGAAVKWLYDFHEKLPESVICEYWMEDVFLQDQFFDDFEAEGIQRGYILPIRGDKRQKPDKYARIEQTAAYYERGIVIYNEKKKNSPDFEAGLQQVLGFSKGTTIHDDAPDADEGAIYILNRRARVNANEARIGKRRSRYNF